MEGRSGDDTKAEEVNPFDNSPIFSRVFFLWLTPVLKLGATRPLLDSDIPSAPQGNSSVNTRHALARAWEDEIAAGPGRASLLRAVLRSNMDNVILSISNFFGFLFTAFVQPYLVSLVLRYVTTGSAIIFTVDSGLLAACLLGASSIIGCIFFSLGFYFMQQFGLKTRTALISTLFDKSLNISNKARRTYTTGEIITLMSVDVERIWLALLLGNWIWMGPFMLAVSIVLLWFQVGYPSLIVAGALLFWGYFQEFISAKIGQTRQQFVRFTSERTKLMNEVLLGIRVIKVRSTMHFVLCPSLVCVCVCVNCMLL
jgi:ATP-binding cassette subfamily C (CFTR/MRP) protein 1